jgi:hypothetical protein
MEEKKEQLRLTKLRWKLLKERIGKNIINSFQKTNLKKEEDEEQIELILEEANAYGLRQEVKMWAEKELEKDNTLSKLDAYVIAYHEWIK